jgi:hypothetical protein
MRQQLNSGEHFWRGNARPKHESLVGIEACNTSHYWARELIALGRLQARSSPASPILLLLSAAVTSLRGSALCRGRTPAAAKSGSAASRERATAIYVRCWWSAPWRSFATLSGTAPSAHGSDNCSPGAPRTRPNRTFGAPAEFDSDLDVLEYRYASDPRFIDRAAHILLIGER